VQRTQAKEYNQQGDFYHTVNRSGAGCMAGAAFLAWGPSAP